MGGKPSTVSKGHLMVRYESQTWQRLVQSESPVPSQCWVWRLQAAQQSLQNDIVKRHETTSFCKTKFWICSSSCSATMLLHFIGCLCKTRKKWTHLPVLQLKVALSSVHHRIVLAFSGARCTKSWSMRSAEDLTLKAKLFAESPAIKNKTRCLLKTMWKSGWYLKIFVVFACTQFVY